MNKQQKILTILIPCYNSSKTIEQTLLSLDLKKHQKDINVLIYDDGSKDDTCKIVNKYVKKFPKSIKLIKKKNGNYGSIINIAKNEVETRYIRTLDSDDTLETKNLTKFIKELKQMPIDVDVVFTNFNFINFKTNEKTKRSLTLWFNMTQSIFIRQINKFKAPRSYITIHSITFSNRIFKQIKQLPENVFYSDSYLIYQILKYANYIAYIPHLYIYNYFVFNNSQSISIDNMCKNISHIKEVLKYIIEDSIPTNITSKHLSWLADIINMVIKFYFLSIIKNNDMTMQEKEEAKEQIVWYLKEYINNNRMLYYIFDMQIKCLIYFKLNFMSKVVKFVYKSSRSKFVKASKSKDKK